MPNRPVINQLDPFGENEDEFSTKEIRHSRSRTTGRFFTNLINPEDEKARKRNRTLLGMVPTIIILAVLAIIFIPQLTQKENPSEPPEVLVNPTGRESASSGNLPAFDDPETRAYEQEKLNTVLELVKQDDWEYTNALFETIFPDYLDNCGKYDYYRAAIILADNFEGFSISREVAVTRAEELLKSCDRTAETVVEQTPEAATETKSETTETENVSE